MKNYSEVQAVLCDWAGTLIDFGCMAPVVMFIDAFKQAGVPISLEQARKPMGVPKRSHIQQILEMDTVRARWEKKFGRYPLAQDVDFLNENLMGIPLDSLAHYAVLIPGSLEMAEALRRKNIKIGTTTDYLDETDSHLKTVADQGFVPDFSIPSGVFKSKSYSYRGLQAALEVDGIEVCVKIDDTLPGIQEGLKAGMWTIGVTASGNEMGLTLEQYLNLTPISRREKNREAAQRFYQVGAHYVVETIADILPCLSLINRRLKKGEFPSQPAQMVA